MKAIANDSARAKEAGEKCACRDFQRTGGQCVNTAGIEPVDDRHLVEAHAFHPDLDRSGETRDKYLGKTKECFIPEKLKKQLMADEKPVARVPGDKVGSESCSRNIEAFVAEW